VCKRRIKPDRVPDPHWLAFDIDYNASVATIPERLGTSMASITIRKLEDKVKEKLRVLAAKNGRSMEEEARMILREAVAKEREPTKNLVEISRECFGPYGGVELDLPPRKPMRKPPDLS